MNRVVITGMGVASPVGCGLEAFWESLTTGSSGIGAITLFDASAMPVRIGGEVSDLDCEAVARQFPPAGGDRDRKVLLGLAARCLDLFDSVGFDGLLLSAGPFEGQLAAHEVDDSPGDSHAASRAAADSDGILSRGRRTPGDQCNG